MNDWINKCHFGDNRIVLRSMIDAGVRIQCAVTSPPYFGLRSYGIGKDNGEIGLEATPAEFVAALVDVFGLVRELLADDGVLFLNLGDSYNGYMANQRGTGLEAGRQHSRKYIEPGAGLRTSTLKNKDLIGIPWRVAFALQQPQYTGRIKNEIDRVWLAAMIDGEGCFYVHKRPAGQHSGDGYFRKSDTYSPAFEVANTHKAIVDRCMEIAGCGSVICQEKDRRQPLWRWTVRSDEARSLAREIYPYLVGKQQQCRIICAMPNNGERAEAAWQAMKLLHGGSLTSVDFIAPASCHSPGWYLRQDIIWAKPNPMPESVTDRCTKSHEYLFLLTKSERYYFDADAIKEDAVGQNLHDLTGPGYAAPGQAPNTGNRKALRTDIESRHRSQIKGGQSLQAEPDGRRNRRSVWTVPTQPYAGAHFAVFPAALIEPCILAGSRPGDLVLDPFIGSGTTGEVAGNLGRNWIGCELNPDYAPLQQARTAQRGLAL